MTAETSRATYVAFLRGINVGGHHKVPMKDLKAVLLDNGYLNITTILNSGNVIFEYEPHPTEKLEQQLAELLEQKFGFGIPTIIRTASQIQSLWDSQPFSGHELTKNKRFYISLLRNSDSTPLDIPFESEDKSFQILSRIEANIISVLDLDISSTPKAMSIVEKTYGKDVTTRNWKTIARLIDKIAT